MEILCALAVLSILVLLIAQLMGGATKTMTFSENRMDIEGEMRTVFASMSNDFTNMIKRDDVDVLFSKPQGNDSIFFFSQVAASFAAGVPTNNQCPLSIAGYQVFPYLDKFSGKMLYHLDRYSLGLTWDATGPTLVHLTYPAAANYYLVSGSGTPNQGTQLNTLPYTNGDIPGQIEDANYHVIGDGVFRLEYCFLCPPYVDKNGAEPAYFSDLPQNPANPFQTQTNPTIQPDAAVQPYNFLKNTVAIIVTVAELDPASQRLVPDMSKLANDNAAFPDSGLETPKAPNDQPQLMATRWQNYLDTNSQSLTTNDGVPPLVIPKIRVYQHVFYLNND